MGPVSEDHRPSCGEQQQLAVQREGAALAAAAAPVARKSCGLVDNTKQGDRVCRKACGGSWVTANAARLKQQLHSSTFA
jgi:hypothetical protein